MGWTKRKEETLLIEIEHLTKRYGAVTAVSDLTLHIDSGQIYGFLGPNGAGKSTTMNIMTGCLSATEGTVRIGGYDIFEEPRQAKRLIGYLPEQPPLYLNESPLEYLRFVGRAKGLKGGELAGQMDAVIDQTGIRDVAGRRISELSKGYRQRVGIAQALLGDPQVVVLDEPTVGLDPIQIIEIRDLIRELGKTHTVIFSSHILSEVQAICDQIIMIAHGRLAAFDTPENLEKRLLTPNEIALTAQEGAGRMKELLAAVPGISAVEIRGEEQGRTSALVHTGAEDIDEVCQDIFLAFAGAGAVLLELTPRRASLEDVFLELTEPAVPQEEAPAQAGNDGEEAEP